MLDDYQNLIPIERAARTLGVCLATAHRWRMRGIVNRATGTRHTLRAVRVGGGYRVREADLSAFLAAINGEHAPPAINSTDRASAADAELRRLGA